MGMGRILLGLVIFGGIVIFWGFQEMRLSSGAKSTPQDITCEKLASEGCGDNANVHVTDFIVCDAAYVYQEKKRSGSWSTIWVPLLPKSEETKQYFVSALEAQAKGQTPPMPRNIKVIVQSSKVPNESAMNNFAALTDIRGVVVNKISSLGSDERKILQDSYPGVDFNDVYIIEHDREPASAAKSFGMMGGGAAMAAAGIFGFIRRRNA